MIASVGTLRGNYRLISREFGPKLQRRFAGVFAEVKRHYRAVGVSPPQGITREPKVAKRIWVGPVAEVSSRKLGINTVKRSVSPDPSQFPKNDVPRVAPNEKSLAVRLVELLRREFQRDWFPGVFPSRNPNIKIRGVLRIREVSEVNTGKSILQI